MVKSNDLGNDYRLSSVTPVDVEPVVEYIRVQRDDYWRLINARSNLKTLSGIIKRRDPQLWSKVCDELSSTGNSDILDMLEIL